MIFFTTLLEDRPYLPRGLTRVEKQSRHGVLKISRFRRGLLVLGIAAVFWIAITAWSAKVLSRAICLSVNGRTSVRRNDDTPRWEHRRVATGVPSAGSIPPAGSPPLLLGKSAATRLENRGCEWFGSPQQLARLPSCGSKGKTQIPSSDLALVHSGPPHEGAHHPPALVRSVCSHRKVARHSRRWRL